MRGLCGPGSGGDAEAGCGRRGRARGGRRRHGSSERGLGPRYFPRNCRGPGKRQGSRGVANAPPTAEMEAGSATAVGNVGVQVGRAAGAARMKLWRCARRRGGRTSVRATATCVLVHLAALCGLCWTGRPSDGHLSVESLHPPGCLRGDVEDAAHVLPVQHQRP